MRAALKGNGHMSKLNVLSQLCKCVQLQDLQRGSAYVIASAESLLSRFVYK